MDPNEPGNYPTCPVRWLTGLDCPGCGSLRALHALTAGDLGGALDHNALLVLVLPAVVMMAARWAAARRPPKVLFTRYAGWSALTMVLGWAVVRNLPFEWLAVLRSGRG